MVEDIWGLRSSKLTHFNRTQTVRLRSESYKTGIAAYARLMDASGLCDLVCKWLSLPAYCLTIVGVGMQYEAKRATYEDSPICIYSLMNHILSINLISRR